MNLHSPRLLGEIPGKSQTFDNFILHNNFKNHIRLHLFLCIILLRLRLLFLVSLCCDTCVHEFLLTVGLIGELRNLIRSKQLH